MGTDFIDFTSSISGMTGVGTQKTLHMIFIVDNSGSMRNENRMDAVNQAFRQMIPELQRIQGEVQDNFTIFISVMTFNEDPEWAATPTEINYYIHNDIPASEYVTYFSRAFDELNAKLSRSQFINQPGKIAAPYIMLLTDGAPTNGDDYEEALTRLKSNGWFAGSQRYAVLIGPDTVNDPDARRAVSSFVNDENEGIIDAADAAAIAASVSAKTIYIMEQMTQRKGNAAGEKIRNGGIPQPDPNPFPDPWQNPNPGPAPDPWTNPGPVPDPWPNPNPGPDPDPWPVFPVDDTNNSKEGKPDPDVIFDPNLNF